MGEPKNQNRISRTRFSRALRKAAFAHPLVAMAIAQIDQHWLQDSRHDHDGQRAADNDDRKWLLRLTLTSPPSQ